MITDLKKLVAISASVGVIALGAVAYAEDELDALLSDLETESSEPAAEQAEPAAEQAEADAEAEEAPAEPAADEAAEAAPAEDGDAADEPADEPAGESEEPTDAPAEPADGPAPAASQEELISKTATMPEDELISDLVSYERLRRAAFDEQAKREILEARKSMLDKDYAEAARHYQLAKKLMNDSPATKGYRKECQQGMAEAVYRAALQEEKLGRRDRALKYIKQAVDMRHPKARKQLESWQAADDPDANITDITDVMHVKNDPKHKETRKKNIEHLKRANQYLSVGNLDRALDECELVLLAEPYNREAIRIRHKIHRKRATILGQEKKATREGMIADVDKAWRPPYAIDARELEELQLSTIKKPLGDDPALAQEQSIIRRMKEMKLPTISFKPPATIIDAIDFFRGASKDFDRPDIPLEQRGFNFVLKTPETLRAQAADSSADSDDFSATGDEEASAAQSGVPIIPMITASDITFYDALKLVCESVDYKFKVQGSIVMVMHRDMSVEEMVTRSYPVVAAFIDRMGSASSDIKEMKSQGGSSFSKSSRNDDDEDSQERDWKEFFSLMGVQWPEGSSILYIKTIGKLRVKNTYDNLAELEKALTELNVDQKLIEIEARFVEVCQEDLNSLGFEWILNSDYSLDLGHYVNKALNLGHGKWGETTSSYHNNNTSGTINNSDVTDETYTYQGRPTSTVRTGHGTLTQTESSDMGLSKTYTDIRGGNGNRWSRSAGESGKTLGINGFGGTSDQQNGMRYLSTMSNPISGESKSINDQFMRINAFIGNADLSMILHMLSQRSDTDLLSAPKVLTRPGEEAVIKVVTEYIYPTDYDVQLQSSSSSSGSNSGSSQSAILAVVEPQSFTMREVGVILDVTPTLTDDGNLIDLKLDTKVVDEPTWKNYGMKIPFTGNSSLQNFQGLGEIFTGLSSIFAVLGNAIPDALKATLAEQATDSAGNALQSLTASGDNMTYYDAPMEQPFFHVRSIESNVSIYPGATIVMGGLITETRKSMDDKIPFLGDLPFVGRFFRSHSELTSKRNLLIFITSRLVDVRGREVTLQSNEQKESAEVLAAPEAAE